MHQESKVPNFCGSKLLTLSREWSSFCNIKNISFSLSIYQPTYLSICHEQQSIPQRSPSHTFVSFHNATFIGGGGLS